MSEQLCQLVDAAQKFNEENLSAQLAKDEEKEIRSPEGSPRMLVSNIVLHVQTCPLVT